MAKGHSSGLFTWPLGASHVLLVVSDSTLYFQEFQQGLRGLTEPPKMELTSIT